MRPLRTTIYAKQKAKANTFIGGVSATLNTAALVASKLGVSSGRIKAFKIVGTDIEFAVIGGSYALPNNCFKSNTSITYYNDNNNLVTSGGADCFMGCTNLSYLYLLACVTLAYRFARDCPNLVEIKFNALNGLPSECFTNNYKLSTVNSSFNSLTFLGNLCLQNCRDLTSLDFPNVGLCNISNSTYIVGGCVNLVRFYAPKMTFPSGSGVAGRGLFYGNTKLTDVTLTAMTTIPEEVCNGCSSLVTISFPSAITMNIAYGMAFGNTISLVNLYVPSLTGIAGSGYRAFYNSKINNIDWSKVTNLSALVNDVFELTTGLLTLDIRSCTSSIGTSLLNTNVFRSMKLGVTIYANSIQQTNNSGAVEGDIQYAISSRSATVNYI